MNPKSKPRYSQKKEEEQPPAVLARLLERVKKWADVIGPIVVALIIVGLLGILIIRGCDLAYHQRVLKPQSPKLRIESAAVSHINVTGGGTQLTARWDLTVVFVNPNEKVPVKFRTLQVMLFYLGGSRISSTLLATLPVAAPPLLNHGEQSSVRFRVATAENAYVGSEACDLISEAMGRGGSLFFGVKMMSWWVFDNDWLAQEGYWLVKKSKPLEFQFHVRNRSWTTRWPDLGSWQFDYGDERAGRPPRSVDLD